MNTELQLNTFFLEKQLLQKPNEAINVYLLKKNAKKIFNEILK